MERTATVVAHLLLRDILFSRSSSQQLQQAQSAMTIPQEGDVPMQMGAQDSKQPPPLVQPFAFEEATAVGLTAAEFGVNINDRAYSAGGGLGFGLNIVTTSGLHPRGGGGGATT